MRQVVILAGGKGTRLKERLGDLPKPLIDVCGIPLLEHQILLAKRYGFDRVLILVNHKAQQIVDFCAVKGNWGIAVECIDDHVPLGTAGAVLNILDRLDEQFLVMYGDTMLEIDLKRFCQAHERLPASGATLFLHPNDHPHDSDLVEMAESGEITQFHPYPHQADRFYPNLVNAALYCLSRAALVAYRRDNRTELDFGKHLFPQMIRDGVMLRGYNSPEYIKDCGTPDRIDKVRADFNNGKIAKASLAHKQAAVFLDRDGTLLEEVNHLNSVDQVRLLDGAASAIRRFNREGYKTCLVTNQPVIARGECTIDDLTQIHHKLETLLGREAAYLDRVYYCPHHPDKGFAGERVDLKIACQCRKPNTGMIDQAVIELNIDCADSWLIGDTSTDVATARRAGLKSILVETGYAGKDNKYPVIADFIAPDLETAAALILDIYPLVIEKFAAVLTGVEPGGLIFIGGQARSGKSTYASILKYALLGMGRQCHVLSTDRWILSEADRFPGVLGRHDMMSLNLCLAKLHLRGERPLTLSLPLYLKQERLHQKDADSLVIQRDDIVIIEGVAALATDAAKHAAMRFYVEIEEAERQNRLLAEYSRRGYTSEDAAFIYRERLLDEVPTIDELKQDAIKVKLPLKNEKNIIQT
ncbi:MAG: HAD-IIIA family hydrolase [Burkholderiaceae bacterium]|nr:HAD-IIIA family hydrolase [Burkholderiaceae bacterium]